MAKMILDRNQGETEGGRKFGYVAGDEGGFFFTWMGSLEETLDSIEEDEVDGDGGLDADEVREFLRSKIAADFSLSEAVQEILDAKKAAGEDAYLWLHSSGDCILWPTEESSIDDDGKNAIERWQLTDEEADELRETGEVDEVA